MMSGTSLLQSFALYTSSLADSCSALVSARIMPMISRPERRELGVKRRPKVSGPDPGISHVSFFSSLLVLDRDFKTCQIM